MNKTMNTVFTNFNAYSSCHFNHVSFIPYIIYTLGSVLNNMFDGIDTIITPENEDFIKSIEENTYAVFINTNEPVDIDKIAGNLALIYMFNFQFPVILFDDCEIVLKILRHAEEMVNKVTNVFSKIREPSKSDIEEVISEFIDHESYMRYEHFFEEESEKEISIIYLDFGFIIVKGKMSVEVWVNFLFFVKEQGNNSKINTLNGLISAFNENKRQSVDPNLN